MRFIYLAASTARPCPCLHGPAHRFRATRHVTEATTHCFQCDRVHTYCLVEHEAPAALAIEDLIKLYLV
jgi:hypothetical protein